MLQVVAAAILVFAWSLVAEAASADYLRDVKPLLAEKCISCHGPLKQEAGLRLDAAQLIRKGSESGPIAVAHSPETSRIIERVTAPSADERMPPQEEGTPLNAKQVAMLRDWIAAGMSGPQDEAVLSSPKDHWAYQPVVRPPVPKIPGAANAHPIDAFLAAKQRSAGLQPLARADAATLLRRVSLDLVGLPPTVAELKSFTADNSDAAYRRQVDRLLASSQYGERWGRLWMDVWRYSDWDGFKEELRGSQRNIWHWRDWVIESLNADKGYDRMIEEMLAGDELAPTDPSVVRATGFLARNYHYSNRNVWLDAAVEHTAKAFLGMTLNCARCHDHKFDPIAQPEYYAFRAIFEPYKVRMDLNADEKVADRKEFPRAYDGDLDAKTYLYASGNEKQPDKEHPLAPAVPTVIDLPFHISAITLPPDAYFPALVPSRERDELAKARKKLNVARNKQKRVSKAVPLDEQAKTRAELALEAATANLASLEARWAADKAKIQTTNPAKQLEQLSHAAADAQRRHELAVASLDQFDKKAALVAAETQKVADAQQAAIQKAQQELAAAEVKLTAAREALKKTDATYTPVGEEFPHTSTGRRAALAKWITDQANPLTARVAANHMWMRHFGEPLVAEVFDFGLRSPRPVNADLLDWLAAELVESGWSMKQLHRVMVTSQAYQLASSSDGPQYATNRQLDPDNRLFWRANVQRLDAEVVRDSLLFVSGKLDLTQGGPDIDFQEGEKVPRRSVYFRHAYQKQMTMLLTFDAPSPTECYRRSPSIIPQQALALSNSALGVTLARQLAGALSEQVGQSESVNGQFIEQAYLTVLSREPTPKEVKLCTAFLQDQSKRLADGSKLSQFGGSVQAAVHASGDPQQRARENLVHVLMNHNDFVTVR